MPAAGWAESLERSLRRVRAWLVPANWSSGDWFEEIGAHGRAAAWEAACDYDPAYGVPLNAFVRQRVLTRALTRYRQEWTHARRCLSGAAEAEAARQPEEFPALGSVMVSLRWALDDLPAPDRWLIRQLFWEERAEAVVAHDLQISQQAVSKRKRRILRQLRTAMVQDP
jgi:RNA polymerase sigma-70 factor (ECF subfamily)